MLKIIENTVQSSDNVFLAKELIKEEVQKNLPLAYSATTVYDMQQALTAVLLHHIKGGWLYISFPDIAQYLNIQGFEKFYNEATAVQHKAQHSLIRPNDKWFFTTYLDYLIASAKLLLALEQLDLNRPSQDTVLINTFYNDYKRVCVRMDEEMLNNFGISFLNRNFLCSELDTNR